MFVVLEFFEKQEQKQKKGKKETVLTVLTFSRHLFFGNIIILL